MAGSPSAPGTLYRDASLAAREHSTDALLAYADALAVDVADPGYGDAESNAVARFLAGERLRALTDELERRERLSRIATGVSSVADARYAAWRDLARLVRDRIDITDVFRAVGWDLTRQGHDSRRGGAEWSGACPLCGGSVGGLPM